MRHTRLRKKSDLIQGRAYSGHVLINSNGAQTCPEAKLVGGLLPFECLAFYYEILLP